MNHPGKRENRAAKVVVTLLLTCALMLPVYGSMELAAEERRYAIVPINTTKNSLIVPVSIRGITVQLQVDTGSSVGLTLHKEVINRLGNIEYTGTVTRFSDLAGQIWSAREFVLEEVSVGEVMLGKMQGAEYQNWGLSGTTSQGGNASAIHDRIDGVIGLGAIRGVKMIIDYPGKRLVVFKGQPDVKEYATAKWEAIPITINEDGLSFEAYVDGNKNRLILDTGAQASLYRTSSLRTEKFVVNCDVVFSNWTACKILQMPLVMVGRRNIGPMQFYLMDFEGPTADGIVGIDFLRRYMVYIDLGNQQLRIKEAAGE